MEPASTVVNQAGDRPARQRAQARLLELGDGAGTIYAETVEITEGGGASASNEHSKLEGGAAEIGFVDTLSLLREAITTIGTRLHDAVSATQPHELSVEMNFGFKGEAKLVPLLLNGAGEGSIRVSIKWKREAGITASGS